MNMKQLRALIEAGLTDEQIMNVIGTGKQEPAKDPEPKPAADPEPKPAADPKPDIQQQILQAITGLTETIQASNIAGARNKEPETLDDILGNLITQD